MAAAARPDLSGLPENVSQSLAAFLEAASSAFGDSLRSAVLFGSAAEGRLRATSDVNLLLVLSRFDAGQAGRLRQALRVAEAAIQLQPMFLLEGEVEQAALAFAQKFEDILRRRRVLFGADPLAGIAIPREALRGRLRQSALNLALRLRHAYVARGLREEQLALVLADAAGPLRASAAVLLELEGAPAPSPREALERVAEASGRAEWLSAVRLLSSVRETRHAPVGAAGPAVLSLSELARHLHDRAAALA